MTDAEEVFELAKSTYANENPIEVIRQYCSVIKLPHALKMQLVSDISKWYTNNGADYTVDRLKYIKTCCVRYLSQGSLPPKQSEVWVAKGKDGLFAGPWGALMKRVHQQPQDVLKFIMCYTAFAKKGKPRKSDIKKYRETVTKPFGGDKNVLNELCFYLYRDSKQILKEYIKPDKAWLLKTDIKYPGSFTQKGRFNNEKHKTNIYKEMLDKIHQPEIYNKIYGKSWVEETFAIDLTIDGNPDGGVINYTKTTMGNINWIWEPGNKPRVVCDFFKSLEHLILELGKRLYDFVENVPWDSTFHEEEGYKLIQQKLKEGYIAYCFDLSSATDRFPFELQKWALKSLNLGPIYNEQLDLLLHFMKLDASLPDGSSVKWSVGQPMGSHPSFAMFSLTHGLVLMQYLHSQGLKYEGQFLVHGDDIVIFDKELADYYSQVFLPYIDMEPNEFKSIISSEMAEFNSRLITKDRFIFMRKYRPITFENIQDNVMYWGPQVIEWLPCGKRKKDTIRKIFSIPCVLPGGQSINPKGLSAAARIMLTPQEVLNALFNREGKAKEYVSARQLATTHLRKHDCFTNEGLEFSVGTQYYGDAILQMHLRSLQESDYLDRDVLDDVFNFTNFFSFVNSELNPLVGSYRNEEIYGLDTAQSMFDVIGNIEHEWNTVFYPEPYDKDKCISIRNIRSYNRTNRRSFTPNRLGKLVKLYQKYA